MARNYGHEVRLFHLAMFALGATTVFPWLCFITAADFYPLVFGNTCMFYFAVVNMVPLALTTIYLTFRKVTSSLISRIRLPLIVIIVLLAGVPVVNRLHMAGILGKNLAYTVTLCIIGVVASVDSVMQNAVFGLVGSMVPNEGPGYIISLTTGQRSAGLIVVIIRVATKLGAARMGKNGPEIATMIYFLAAICCIFVSLVLFACARSTRLGQTYLGPASQGRESLLLAQDAAEAKDFGSINDGNPAGAGVAGEVRVKEIRGSGSGSGEPAVQTSQWRLVKHTMWQAKESLFCVFLVFVVCLSCFPGLATSLNSHLCDPQDWFPVVMVSLYNVGDFIGVSLPSDNASRLFRSLGCQLLRNSCAGRKRVAEVKVTRGRYEGCSGELTDAAMHDLAGGHIFKHDLEYEVILTNDVSVQSDTQSNTVFIGGPDLHRVVEPFSLIIHSPKALLCLTAVHLLFIPLFVLGCQSAVLPSFMQRLWYPCVITLSLGIATGFLTCTANTVAPRQVGNSPAEAQQAGVVFVFWLMSGLLAGSVVGIVLSQIKLGPVQPPALAMNMTHCSHFH